MPPDRGRRPTTRPPPPANPAQDRQNYRATSYSTEGTESETSAEEPPDQEAPPAEEPVPAEEPSPVLVADDFAPYAVDPDKYLTEEMYFTSAAFAGTGDSSSIQDKVPEWIQERTDMSVFCTGVVDGLIANKSFRNGKVFPCLINGKRAFAAWDTLSDICCADLSVFEALGISATKGNVLLSGIVEGAKATGLKYVEDVRFVSTQGKVSANLLCHLIGRGRIILSDKAANDLGVTFSLPIGFPTLDPQSDKEWAKTQPGVRKEKRAPPEVIKIVEDMIAPELEAHKNLPDNITVSDSEAVFRLALKQGANHWWVKQYLILMKWFKLVDKMIDLWAKKGWIIPAPPDCKINNPILPRLKISGGKVILGIIRLCLDARWLNKFTVGGFHIIPDGHTIFISVGDFDFLLEADIDNGYNRIRLHPSCRIFTSFTQPSNGMCWMFTVLIYGIEGASRFFQRRILYSIQGLHESNKVYLDNIYTHTKHPNPKATLKEKATLHGTAVKATLKALLEANWKVKLAKCNFAFVALQVLGSLFQQATRSVDPKKLVDLSKKGVPRTQKQLVSLLTFINYLRDFIPSYNRILGPLESLRPKKKISQEDWVTVKADKSLEDVLEVLNSGVVLHLPSAEAGPFFIDVDASQFGVGAVLYQRPKEKVVHYIAFTSKKFNTAQRNYPAGKRELLALVNALQRWRHIIFGFKIFALVDHKALTYMSTSTNYMILDWLNFLQQFELVIIHCPGIKHIVPDALSHLYELAPKPPSRALTPTSSMALPKPKTLHQESTFTSPLSVAALYLKRSRGPKMHREEGRTIHCPSVLRAGLRLQVPGGDPKRQGPLILQPDFGQPQENHPDLFEVVGAVLPLDQFDCGTPREDLQDPPLEAFERELPGLGPSSTNRCSLFEQQNRFPHKFSTRHILLPLEGPLRMLKLALRPGVF